MTFVYPLGSGSKHDDFELKLSLRSVEKYCNPTEVFIIGEKPSWLDTDYARFIPYPDHSVHNKDGNMIQKILLYSKIEWTDSFFIRMSDDQVILKPEPDFMPYHNGLLDEVASLTQGDWYKRAFFTVKMLRDVGYNTFNFDIHAPVLIHKKDLSEVVDRIDRYFAFYDRGYVINSLIFNMVGGAYGFKYDSMPDKHVLRLKTADWEDPEGYTFLNFNDYAFTDKLQKWLLNRFPTPSKFEK